MTDEDNIIKMLKSAKYKFSLLIDEWYDYIYLKDKLNEIYYCIQINKASKRFKEIYSPDREDLYKNSIVNENGDIIRLYE